jgi:hypothetical protein
MTGEKALKGAELLDEVQWLLDGHVDPRLVLQELHTNATRVEVTARRHGRRDLSAVFQPIASERRRNAA